MAEDFKLTDDNYYSDEANREYMSVHQYLDFVGSLGRIGCEERAMAKLNGTLIEPPSKAMLVGSYVDSYFEGTLDKFKALHPEIFTQKGELKADYRQADKMIAKCESDEYFMQTMSGEKQVIMTANMFGCAWKIKMDSYIHGVAIVDLKTTSDLHKAWKVENYGWVSVPEYWGYITQAAVYQKVVEINTGERLPFYLSFVTKEDEPELCVVYIDQDSLDHALEDVKANIGNVLSIKNGEVAPIGCGKCAYCKSRMKLSAPIHYTDLISID